ncbi:hypothetical protein [Variovorax sp. PAMC26660]|uniref:hypothetical protein n=1 Tax=Variovorax sp. PAMC26660 TaxID=2762322 RepID=UPI00164E325C|nr:hypothetical protein [Variovorax sp. PAMC26660]QNK66096.1 hypothetical protein H7F35_23230 [Variovorax sp. PAMC26660]
MTAMMQAQMSQEQLNWAKQMYAQEAPEREAAQRVASETSAASMDQMRLQTKIQQQSWDDYNQTYRPLEQSLVKEAQEYDTPERRAAAAASASADVERGVSAQREATAREMERAGVNPASGKVVAMAGSMDLGAAKAKAGAANQASKAIETVGYARKMDAANLGRNIASAQGTSAALGLQAGAAANSASGAGIAAGQAGVAGMNAAYAGAQQGLAGSGQQYGNIASSQNAAAARANSNLQQGVGGVMTIAGAVI